MHSCNIRHVCGVFSRSSHHVQSSEVLIYLNNRPKNLFIHKYTPVTFHKSSVFIVRLRLYHRCRFPPVEVSISFPQLTTPLFVSLAFCVVVLFFHVSLLRTLCRDHEPRGWRPAQSLWEQMFKSVNVWGRV